MLHLVVDEDQMGRDFVSALLYDIPYPYEHIIL